MSSTPDADAAEASAARRRASWASTARWSSGRLCATSRKSLRSSDSSRTRVSARSGAGRRCSRTSDSSPMKSPGPKCAASGRRRARRGRTRARPRGRRGAVRPGRPSPRPPRPDRSARASRCGPARRGSAAGRGRGAAPPPARSRPRRPSAPRPARRRPAAPSKLVVQAAGREQLLVRALLREPAAGEHEDAVGVDDRREPVADAHDRAARARVGEAAAQVGLGAGVERARRLVKDEDGRVAEQRPGDGEALALAAAHPHAAVSEDGLIAGREARDELVQLRRLGGGDDLLVGRVGAAEGDVRPHRRVEDERVLEDHAELAPQTTRR